MKEESNTKEPLVDYTELGPKGNAPEAPQAHSQEVTHVLMTSSGDWVEVIKGSFKLYKTNKGVPFIEFKPKNLININKIHKDKIVQLFPAAISGWAFDES